MVLPFYLGPTCLHQGGSCETAKRKKSGVTYLLNKQTLKSFFSLLHDDVQNLIDIFSSFRTQFISILRKGQNVPAKLPRLIPQKFEKNDLVPC